MFVKDDPAWVWIALSRRNFHIVGFHIVGFHIVGFHIVGFHIVGRSLDDARQLWQQVPAPWKRCLVFTDAYPVYERLFQDRPR